MSTFGNELKKEIAKLTFNGTYLVSTLEDKSPEFIKGVIKGFKFASWDKNDMYIKTQAIELLEKMVALRTPRVQYETEDTLFMPGERIKMTEYGEWIFKKTIKKRGLTFGNVYGVVANKRPVTKCQTTVQVVLDGGTGAQGMACGFFNKIKQGEKS